MSPGWGAGVGEEGGENVEKQRLLAELVKLQKLVEAIVEQVKAIE